MQKGVVAVKDLVDTTEMYLRTIYELEEEGITPLRARIAERLEQSGPTVSQTVARMERDNLVIVRPDRSLEMTPEGLMGLDTSAPDTPADVQVEPVSSNTLRLWWTALKVNDLDHYNVYCAETSEFELSQATLVGSPSEAEFVDWGLRPGRSYWYKVTAVDRHGNESGPGEVIEGVLPEIATPVRITLEAPKAKRHNMEVIDSSAAGGRILTPGLKEEEPTAEWRFRVPADGVYALWGRTVHQREQPTAYTIVLDGEAVGEWKVYGRWGQWVWSPLGDKTSGSPTLFRLSQGNHDLRLIAHTPTSRVAEVVVTNDPTWWPLEGYRGENMAV